MTDWVIVKISTGSIVDRGFESRGDANAYRWERYEEGHSNDQDYTQIYGVEKIDE